MSEGRVRYMMQDTFDMLAISRAMTRHVPDQNRGFEIFSEAVRSYKWSYPAENVESLLSDTASAASEVETVATIIYESLANRHALNKDLLYVTILRLLMRRVKEQALKNLPVIKRIFRGACFNYEKTPLKNRVQKCKEDILSAGQTVMVKDVLPALLDR